jgi:hypothetical protein
MSTVRIRPLITHRRVIRYTTCLLAISAIVGTCPTAARSAVADLWSSYESEQALAQETEISQRLDDEDNTVQRRIAVKEALIDQLIEDHATLAEVSEAFLQLDSERPAYLLVLRSTFQGGTDQEKMINNIMNYLDLRTANRSCRASVFERVEKERAQKARDEAQAGR